MPKTSEWHRQTSRTSNPAPPLSPYDTKLRRRQSVRQAQAEVGDVVYYIRRNSAIKIGYTSDLLNRMRYHKIPLDQVLAVEPGGPDTEQAIHGRFAHLRVTPQREEFTLGPDLLAHINMLRAKVHAPPVSE